MRKLKSISKSTGATDQSRKRACSYWKKQGGTGGKEIESVGVYAEPKTFAVYQCKDCSTVFKAVFGHHASRCRFCQSPRLELVEEKEVLLKVSKEEYREFIFGKKERRCV
jgi:hypothetical protein